MKLLLPFLLLTAACEENDLGKDCALAPSGTTGSVTENPSDSEVVFAADVRTDGKCESFQCVSTQVRRDYCSRECITNRNCPEGFECTQLQPVGPFSQRTFCLLAKPCRPGVAGDCPKDTMICREVNTSTEEPAYFCDVLNEGEQPQ